MTQQNGEHVESDQALCTCSKHRSHAYCGADSYLCPCRPRLPQADANGRNAES
jgi:hypothetical protein